jgi:hypothetical protein
MGSHVDIVDLAAAQLEAYNRADVDAFCACYAEDVVVLDEAGAQTLRGQEAFRAGYVRLFATFRDVQAGILTRVAMGRHCIDHERWSRVHRETGERMAGEILVRYTGRDGKIAIVQFLR